MNREDIIRMAREAGIIPLNVECDPGYVPIIERFAALVAAAEREAIKQSLPGRRKTDDWDSMREADRNSGWNACQAKAVAAIRARGQA